MAANFGYANEPALSITMGLCRFADRPPQVIAPRRKSVITTTQARGEGSAVPSNLLLAGLSALGVVFADRATSPLYTLKPVLALTGSSPAPAAMVGSLPL